MVSQEYKGKIHYERIGLVSGRVLLCKGIPGWESMAEWEWDMKTTFMKDQVTCGSCRKMKQFKEI